MFLYSNHNIYAVGFKLNGSPVEIHGLRKVVCQIFYLISNPTNDANFWQIPKA